MSNFALNDPTLLTSKAYFAGAWQTMPKGQTIAVTNPFDSGLVGTVPALCVDEARAAIGAAAAAQPAWAQKTAKERAQTLRRWHELIIENPENLALILTREHGKPYGPADLPAFFLSSPAPPGRSEKNSVAIPRSPKLPSLDRPKSVAGRYATGPTRSCDCRSNSAAGPGSRGGGRQSRSTCQRHGAPWWGHAVGSRPRRFQIRHR